MSKTLDNIKDDLINLKLREEEARKVIIVARDLFKEVAAEEAGFKVIYTDVINDRVRKTTLRHRGNLVASVWLSSHSHTVMVSIPGRAWFGISDTDELLRWLQKAITSYCFEHGVDL